MDEVKVRAQHAAPLPEDKYTYLPKTARHFQALSLLAVCYPYDDIVLKLRDGYR
jgi:hypothetical protein